MTGGSTGSRWELLREAVISPALLLVIFGVSGVVMIATAWTGEIATLKPLHAQLEFIEPALRDIDLAALLTFGLVNAFIYGIKAIGKGEAEYHPIRMIMRENAHKRRMQKLECKHAHNKRKLEYKHELEDIAMAQLARSRINHALAPKPGFPIRLQYDSTHVVSINKRAQAPES